MKNLKKLLLVTDGLYADNKESFSVLFLRCGIDLTITETAKEAIKQIKAIAFDLVVTDIALKDGRLAGLDMLRKIRATNKEIKIIISTDYDEYREEALKAGATDYQCKPYDFYKVFFDPLGIEPGLAVRRMCEQSLNGKKKNLRTTIHDMGNKHNMVVLVSSLLKEELKSFLKNDKDIPEKYNAMFKRALEDLADIEQGGNDADMILKNIRRVIYKKVDPDTVMIDE